MVELPLLRPVEWLAAVEKINPPGDLVLLNRFPKGRSKYPMIAWDVTRATRMVAKPNVPNAEAHVVPRQGRTAEARSWINTREKMTFEPTTSMLLKEIGSDPTLLQDAERAILEDIAVLSDRVDNFQEVLLWSALSGRIKTSFKDVVVDVDFYFPASHVPTLSVGWDVATPQQIIADIKAWKKLILRDGKVNANEAYATENTIDYIFNAFARVSDGTAQGLLSDRMRDEYLSTGTFNGFMGLQVNLVKSTYQEDTGRFTDFVPDNAFYMGDYVTGNPVQMMEGPCYDHDAPQGWIGKFSKTWKDPDPSSRQALLDTNFFPVVRRVESLLYVPTVVNPTP